MKKIIKFVIFWWLASTLILATNSCLSEIDSTEDLISAIEKKYNGKGVDHVKFCRTARYYDNDNNNFVRSEKWISEYKYPGQLLIKINHEDSPNGYLYKHDSVYVFENNKVIDVREHKYELLFYGLDIYNMTKKEFISSLNDLGFDMSRFHIKEHDGRKSYVIGAKDGDLASNQIWFNTKNLLVHKVIKNTEDGILETTYNNYINIRGNNWINQNITFKFNDEIYFTGYCYDINIPDKQRKEILVSDFMNNNIIADDFFFEKFDNTYYYKCLEAFTKIN